MLNIPSSAEVKYERCYTCAVRVNLHGVHRNSFTFFLGGGDNLES